MKVKPKIVIAARELADAAKIFKAFQKKHEVTGRQVFTRRLDFYLDALKFDAGKSIAGLDEEIDFFKRLIDQTNNQMLFLEHSLKIKELSEALSLAEAQNKAIKDQALQAEKQIQLLQL